MTQEVKIQREHQRICRQKLLYIKIETAGIFLSLDPKPSLERPIIQFLIAIYKLDASLIAVLDSISAVPTYVAGT